MVLKPKVNILNADRNIVKDLHCKLAEVPLVFISRLDLSFHFLKDIHEHFLEIIMIEYILEHPVRFILWRNNYV